MRKELQNIKIFFFHVLVPHAKQFSKVDSPEIIMYLVLLSGLFKPYEITLNVHIKWSKHPKQNNFLFLDFIMQVMVNNIYRLGMQVQAGYRKHNIVFHRPKTRSCCDNSRPWITAHHDNSLNWSGQKQHIKLAIKVKTSIDQCLTRIHNFRLQLCMVFH